MSEDGERAKLGPPVWPGKSRDEVETDVGLPVTGPSITSGDVTDAVVVAAVAADDGTLTLLLTRCELLRTMATVADDGTTIDE